ncbi:hypothetical protein HDU93_001723 [Gonapodya sp. JEL0774]|nr:hypothetical protein HDU93_001723 [Gonapodya sp. JEL0774]
MAAHARGIVENGNSAVVVDGLKGRMVDFGGGELVFVPDEVQDGNEGELHESDRDSDGEMPGNGRKPNIPGSQNGAIVGVNEARIVVAPVVDPMAGLRFQNLVPPRATSAGSSAPAPGPTTTSSRHVALVDDVRPLTALRPVVPSLHASVRVELLSAPHMRSAVEQVRAVLGDGTYSLQEVQEAVLIEGGEIERAIGRLLDDGTGAPGAPPVPAAANPGQNSSGLPQNSFEAAPPLGARSGISRLTPANIHQASAGVSGGGSGSGSASSFGATSAVAASGTGKKIARRVTRQVSGSSSSPGLTSQSASRVSKTVVVQIPISNPALRVTGSGSGTGAGSRKRSATSSSDEEGSSSGSAAVKYNGHPVGLDSHSDSEIEEIFSTGSRLAGLSRPGISRGAKVANRGKKRGLASVSPVRMNRPTKRSRTDLEVTATTEGSNEISEPLNVLRMGARTSGDEQADMTRQRDRCQGVAGSSVVGASSKSSTTGLPALEKGTPSIRQSPAPTSTPPPFASRSDAIKRPSSTITPPSGVFDPWDYTPSAKPVVSNVPPDRPPVGLGGLGAHLFTLSVRLVRAETHHDPGVMGSVSENDGLVPVNWGSQMGYGKGVITCQSGTWRVGVETPGQWYARIPCRNANTKWGDVARLVKADVLTVQASLYPVSQPTNSNSWTSKAKSKRKSGSAVIAPSADDVNKEFSYPFELRLYAFLSDRGARYGEHVDEDGYCGPGDGKKAGKGGVDKSIFEMLTSRTAPDAATLGFLDGVGQCTLKSYVSKDHQLADAFYRADLPVTKYSLEGGGLDALLALLRPPLDAPQAQQPASLTVSMYPFQRRALWWMMERELNLLPDGDILHPLWIPYRIMQSEFGDLRPNGKLKRMLTGRAGDGKRNPEFLEIWRPGRRARRVLGRRWYLFFCPWAVIVVYSAFSLKLFNSETEMGLGKTVEVIALILAHPRGPFDASRSAHIMHNLSDIDRPGRVKATLIVAPQAIMGQWAEELARLAPGLVVMEYLGTKGRGFGPEGGTDRLSAMKRFGDADVVLTTYETLQSDLGKTTLGLKSPLLNVQWWRVCVDEAQLVANTNGAAAQMASELWRVNGWTVTGTPISNSLTDLHGLAVFLDHDPFANGPILNHSVINPWLKRLGGSKALRLPGYLRKFMWRHSKEDVAHEMEIPPMSHHELRMTFSKTEALWYQRLLADAKGYLKTIFQAKGSLTLDTQVMARILELRQACNHPQIASRFVQKNKERLTEKQILLRVQQETALELADLELDWVFEAMTLSYGLLVEKAKLGKRLKDIPFSNLNEVLTSLLKPCLNVINVNLQRVMDADERLRRLHVYFGETPMALIRWLRAKFSTLNLIEQISDSDPDLIAERTTFPNMSVDLNPRDVELRFYNIEFVKVASIQAENHEGLRNRAVHEEVRTPKRHVPTIWQSLKRKENDIKVKEADLRHVNNQIEEKTMKEHCQVTSHKDTKSGIARPSDGSSLSSITHVDTKGKGKAVVEDLIPLPQNPERNATRPTIETDECIICNVDYINRCRAEVAAKDFLEVGEEENESDQVANLLAAASHMEVDMSALFRESVEGEYGTKISGLIVDIKERIAMDPAFKAVVFTAWKNMHDMVFEALWKNGIITVNFSLPGMERRREALEAIKSDPKVKIILVSMKSREGAAGLTLTCCNAVYLLEPNMNPGLEAQAINRVNRIGQTRPTTVIRLIIGGTIEEKILQYAESKKATGQNLLVTSALIPAATSSSSRSAHQLGNETLLGEKEEFQTGQVLEMFGLNIEELAGSIAARPRRNAAGGGSEDEDEESEDGSDESDAGEEFQDSDSDGSGL